MAGVPIFSEKTTTGVVTTGLMVMLRVKWVCPEALLALMMTFEVPVVVGVPEMRPVVGWMDNPAGNPLAAKDVGEFVAVI